MPMLNCGKNRSRVMPVSQKTINVIHQIIEDRPGLTTVDYATELQVSPIVVNAVIENHPNLLDLANAGKLAVSHRGIKPNWYYLLPDQQKANVQIKSSIPRNYLIPTLPSSVTNPDIVSDASGALALLARIINKPPRSPIARQKIIEEYGLYITSLAENFQITHENAKGLSDEKITLETRLNRIENFLSLNVETGGKNQNKDGPRKGDLIAVG